MYGGKIIDTQMHLWDIGNPYPWLNHHNPNVEALVGNYDKLKKNFLAKDYIALTKKYKIAKAVHLQVFGFPDDPVLETKWLQQEADKYHIPQGIVAYAALADSLVEDRIKKHCEYANVRGIRMPLNFDEKPYLCMTDRKDYMRDPKWQYGFSLLEKYHLSFDLSIYAHQLEDAIALANEFPNITIILEHLGWPLDFTKAGFLSWQKKMSDLAECPNVMLKISGLGVVFQQQSLETIMRYIQIAIQIFGVDRSVFGSNFPTDGLFYDFGDYLNICKNAFSAYSEEEQHKIFYSNAEKIYRL